MTKITSFIDDTNYEENPSDYYEFLNLSRVVESDEEDAFSESDVKIERLNSDEAASNNEDIFANSKEKMKDFNKTLKILHGEDNLDSLLYAMFYSIQFEKKKKLAY